ncbi:hypothetical protein FRX31_016887 [Thalictrum thalictroides]|uniref:Uncharacterized protein n=1 Tax=Thalictrum thalictroides TaxID=46969 RepID=A0A7J6W7Z9_THATH|nr:hypothetical protein FRX31_016887 [Thalictrum thalictroides]
MISGCVGLIFTQIAPCPTLWLLVPGMFIVMSANLVSKVNSTPALIEFGRKLCQEFVSTFLDKYHEAPGKAASSGWFVLKYLLEVGVVATIYLFGEVVLAARVEKLGHCKKH